LSGQRLAILGTGLVTPVGLTAAASCAAIRAKVSNPTETRFIDATGKWILGHEVPLERHWRGRARLAKMAAIAIDEALDEVPRSEWTGLPLFLCVAEPERPGRPVGVDDLLIEQVQRELDVRFAADSALVPFGRVGLAAAMASVRKLFQQQKASLAIVAAVDTLLTGAGLRYYEGATRLLTPRNSNGFIPGEGAGALLVGVRGGAALYCTGLGFGVERAHIDSEEPLRADGLTAAVTSALADADLGMEHMDLRISDVSGEQYYFKEAALLVSRTLRVRKETMDIWNPAECTGEAGALAGPLALAVADAACRKGYARGSRILAHMANDAGPRTAIVLEYRSN
jgi:3-oxoacyl-[acyl-carrier-protein] synthase-1